MLSASPPAPGMEVLMLIVRCTLAALCLAGCTSLPPANDDLRLARSLVEEARVAGAALYAPEDLDKASDRLNAAENALRHNDYAQAKPLMQEATVYAQLALAKTGTPGARARLLAPGDS